MGLSVVDVFVLLVYLIPIAILLVIGYFLVKAAVKNGILEAHRLIEQEKGVPPQN
ncbi:MULTISPECIES: DUF6019 family protein [Coriobacteriia]|uniref:DUF6019 family protein n=1 Tax=Adlercreutzia faecimuris TaxID=2897341 RepID=A0ABS9WDV9_9ACTN|nr:MULTISPECIES: DUF6019 family protein [Coriobacteriia]MCI2241048.1 DUF6019 family protein [Adlercreutzia sp. JBNU-10]